MPPAPLLTRSARPDEADDIRAFVRAAYARWVPILTREPSPMNADYQKAIEDHRFDIVDSEDGAILAVIETQVRDDHFWIENVAVAPDAQGKGFGRQLMALAEQRAAEAGRDELRLLTNGLMTANIRLYQSLGYVIDTEEPFLTGTIVHMSKRLGR
jgi:ribosomal protein S18 acetylase RimI-like enzyme